MRPLFNVVMVISALLLASSWAVFAASESESKGAAQNHEPVPEVAACDSSAEDKDESAKQPASDLAERAMNSGSGMQTDSAMMSISGLKPRIMGYLDQLSSPREPLNSPRENTEDYHQLNSTWGTALLLMNRMVGSLNSVPFAIAQMGYAVWFTCNHRVCASRWFFLCFLVILVLLHDS